MKKYEFNEIADEINTIAFCECIKIYIQIGYNSGNILKDIKIANRACLDYNKDIIDTVTYRNKSEKADVSSISSVKSVDETLVSSEELKKAYIRACLDIHREKAKRDKQSFRIDRPLEEIAQEKFKKELSIKNNLADVKFMQMQDNILNTQNIKNSIILFYKDNITQYELKSIIELSEENLVIIITNLVSDKLKRIGITSEDNKNIYVYSGDNNDIITKYYS